jgi:serine/threonine-protein kinase
METRWGKRFGRYEIIAELGRGAMGVVYKSRDPKIDRFVAVKTISLAGLNPEEEREYRERFFHEAQAAGRLLHPGIVTIFDTGEDPESHTAYIVMEYVAGQSLDRLLSDKNKRLPLGTALRLTEELAEALDHAHAQGVVHRDMKPANILVTAEGHAKIADFGIAKLNLAHMTLPGRALGTPAYMSPEQLEGEQVDGRSDLFSLGAILYSMVTGFGPFQGNSATTVCFKIANRDPLRASAFDPGFPPELDAIIARAMAKDPAERYQRGLEFALDLRELRERGEAKSKAANGASLLSPGGETIARSASDATTKKFSASLAWLDLLKTPAQAARKIFSFISLQASSRWRMPVVRIGLVFSVVMVILSLFAFHHHDQPSRGSNQVGPPVAIGTSGEPAPAVSAPLGIDYNAGKVSDSKTPSKAAVGASAEPAPAVSVPLGKHYNAGKVYASKTPSKVAVGASTEPAPAVSAPVEHRAAKISDSRTVSNVVADSTLDIRIEHRFSAADLSLWIDDKLAYDHPLRGQTKKHWNPFRTDVRETETVQVAAGQHRLLVRVRSAPEKYEQSASILGSFAKDHPTTLQINFERQGKAMRLALR